MVNRALIGKATAFGLLAISLAFSSSGLALAQPLDDIKTVATVTRSVPTDMDLSLRPLAEYDTNSDVNLAENDLATLDEALRIIMQAKVAAGDVTYTVSDEGGNVYVTEIIFGDNGVVQFYYEADPTSS
ncbi:hypothetical protein O6R08_07225 [Cutibacterium equinum]|uniref:Uncharacterized protein n=1 Tax=Cutibacterium equinum TaxID=3016342 RepID=A0ABY7QW88_9ACTN|nr:hypothetical protein [Cutibacterium equinum]WCC79327.1 hypothetical protein O6R08_07225 [Cutibacterium equinum]